jgi:tight adherence protein B
MAIVLVMVLVVAIVGGVLLMAGGGSGGKMASRLKRVAGDGTLVPAEKDEKVSLVKQVKDSSIPFLDAFLKSALPGLEKTRMHLARAGVKITASEYFLIMGITGFVLLLMFHYLFGMKTILAVIFSVFLGYFLPHKYIKMKANSRAKKFIKFFPESIDAMVRSIRSGLPIAEAINVVAAEMPDPIGEEFRNIRDGVRMGRSLEEAMWDVAKRLDVAEYRYLIIALSIQRETGGNLAETLYNVSEVLRKRRQLKLKIKAMSSEAKASAMILGSLPFFVSGVLALVSNSYISILVTDTRGQILVGIAGCMMGTGIFIMSNMINFDF